MIKIYGKHRSRAARCMWLLEEIGHQYERIEIDHFGDQIKQQDYLALNPNGRVPTMVDDGFVLWESMAINFYLAQRYGGDFWPSDVQSLALARQWSFWGMTMAEPAVDIMLSELLAKPAEERDAERLAAGLAHLDHQIGILNRHLGDREYLISDDFSLADLNLAAILSITKLLKYDWSKFADADGWITRCLGRPAYARARGD